MGVVCNSCGESFEDFQELALHISSSKTGHKHGKAWAAKYIHRGLIHKTNFENGRTPLSAEDIKNRTDTRRRLSGEMAYVNTICPHCKKTGRPLLESEYVESVEAWRIGDRLVKMCALCGSR